jgi:hypothetical protein
MLEFLRGRASDRKLRLFAVACCRRVWNLLEEDAFRSAVEISECFAEGRTSKRDVRTASDRARAAARSSMALWYGPVPDAPNLDTDTIAEWHPSVALSIAVVGARSPRRFAWVAAYAA